MKTGDRGKLYEDESHNRLIRDKIDKDRSTKRGMSNREKVTGIMRWCLVAMR